MGDAIRALAQQGYVVALDFAPELQSAPLEAVFEAAECQLHGGGFTPGRLGGLQDIAENVFKGVLEALRNLKGEFLEAAFGSARKVLDGFDPRAQRIFVQLAIGQGLVAGGEVSLAAAQLYLNLLGLPGSLSFQMFREPLVRSLLIVMREPHWIAQVGDTLVEPLCAVLRAQNVCKQLVETDVLKPAIETVMKIGSQKPNAQEKLLEALKSMAALQRDSRDLLEMDGDDDAEGSISVSKKKKKKKNESQAMKQAILKVLLSTLKEGNDTASTDWATTVLGEFLHLEDLEGNEVSTMGLTMLEHLCFDNADKTDARANIRAQVLKVIERLAELVRHATLYKFCQFLSKLSHSKEIVHRSLASEIAGSLYECSGYDVDLVQGLSELLLFRAEDKSPAVRVIAIRSLGNIGESPLIRDCEDGGVDEKIKIVMRSTLRILGRRMADSRPRVRRAAVKAIQGLICNNTFEVIKSRDLIIAEDFALLCRRSEDSSPMIRTAVLQTASSFSESFPLDERVQRLWARVALPMILDPEASVQKAAREATMKGLFMRIMTSESAPISWRLLAELSQEELSYVQQAFFEICHDEKLKFQKTAFMKSVSASASQFDDVTVSNGAWILLGLLSGGAEPAAGQSLKDKLLRSTRKAIHPEVIMAAWKFHFQNSEREDGTDCRIAACILNVIIAVSSSIAAETATSMATEIFELIFSMSLENDLVRKALRALTALCNAKAPSEEEARKLVQHWAKKLMDKAEDILRRIGQSNDTEDSSADAEAAVFLVGELALLGFDPDDASKALVPLNDQLTTLTMGLLVEGEDATSKLTNKFHLRPHALVATGKVCLRNGEIAKETIRMLVRELSECMQSEVIRSNVIVILGDLCRRYTNLIDPHMDNVSASLMDPAHVVRRHAVILITGLLQEDFIKWRPLLFVRYAMCLVDPDPEIRRLARYALKEIFPSKNPNLYHGQFLDLIFVLNKLQTAKYTMASYFEPREDHSALEKVRIQFSRRVTGKDGTSAELRKEIYEFLLENMSDTHRLETTNKLCRDILGDIIDGMLPLEQANAVLADTFTTLMSKHMKVKATSAGMPEADADEDISASASQAVQEKMAQAKNKVLSKLEQRNYMEHVIPLAISFYRLLQRERSAHLRSASQYLGRLQKDFPAEMEQVVGADKVLAQELKYASEREAKEEAKAERGKKKKIKASKEVQSSKKRRSETFATPVQEEPAAKKVKSVARSNRRLSKVTFQPTEKDTAERTTAGVLKTPIPSSSKKRRKSLLINSASLTAPRLAPSEADSSEENTPNNGKRLTLSGGGPLTALKSARKWNVTPTAVVSKDLNESLMAIE